VILPCVTGCLYIFSFMAGATISGAFVAKAAQVYLGDSGLYLAGAIAGLTDVDAIALSMAQLAGSNAANAEAAGRTIVIAVASNTLVKAGMAAFLGAPGLRRIMLPAAAVILIAGAAAVWLR